MSTFQRTIIHHRSFASPLANHYLWLLKLYICYEFNVLLGFLFGNKAIIKNKFMQKNVMVYSNVNDDLLRMDLWRNMAMSV